MARYIITYLGGEQPSDPKVAEEHMERYREWLRSLGDAIVSALNPLKDTHVIASDGETSEGSSTAMSGFTVVEANSLGAVLEMSKSCPFLEIGGSLEVSELMQIGAKK